MNDVLVIESDHNVQRLLKILLEREYSFNVDLADTDIHRLERRLDKNYQLIIISFVPLPPYGFYLFEMIRRHLENTDILAILPYRDIRENLQKSICARIKNLHIVENFDECAKVAGELLDPFSITFENYLKMDSTQTNAIQQQAVTKYKEWIDLQFEKYNADWIVVCGKKVVKWSDNPDEYPSLEEWKKIGKKYNRIPFIYSRPPLIEESLWSKTPKKDDYYPSLNINVGKEEKKRIGDLDTGSDGSFFDFEWLIQNDIVILERHDFLQFDFHLNKRYWFYRKKLEITITDENNTKKKTKLWCFCVKDWKHSPFCKINPTRQALIGRDILLKFKLRLELYTKNPPKTKVYHL